MTGILFLNLTKVEVNLEFWFITVCEQYSACLFSSFQCFDIFTQNQLDIRIYSSFIKWKKECWFFNKYYFIKHLLIMHAVQERQYKYRYNNVYSILCYFFSDVHIYLFLRIVRSVKPFENVLIIKIIVHWERERERVHDSINI